MLMKPRIPVTRNPKRVEMLMINSVRTAISRGLICPQTGKYR